MTPKQILLVKNSFQLAAAERDRLTPLFFAELFARESSLRPLFGGDLAGHGAQLFAGLAEIVASLDRLYPIVPVLEWLAVRNRRRGIGERHYGAVGAALLATLAAGLGDGFTREVREAWTAAQRVIAEMMSQAVDLEPLAA